jgi:glycosyltransferase involved in cell wall biosynthesis
MDREPLPAVPRISVILPLYNGILYLTEALDSIARQTHAVDEVIVVDDGSSDGGPAVAEACPQVRLVRKEHSGIIPTLNRGLDEATGDLITFLDHDDRWVPDKTALQLTFLRQRPDVDVVFGRARQFRMTEPRPGREYEVPIEELEGACKCAGMFRRRAFARVGHFGSQGGHDFLDWYTLGREAGLIYASLPEVMFERRQHFSNTGRLDRERHVQSYMATIRAKLARQRAAAGTRNGDAEPPAPPP